MKHFGYLVAATLAFASCSKTELINENKGVDSVISFSVSRQNATKVQKLNETQHYNFGVFAYKNTDVVNNIMENYLVGFMDETAKKGYYMSEGVQTTFGDAAGTVDGKSLWQYEMLGKAEYTYVGTEGYYTKDQTRYMSNLDNQYLRYWDLSSESTSFYAYAPYINGQGTATFDNSTKVLTIPDGSVVAASVDGNDTPEACEYMYAATKVSNADYKKDVQLNFRRLISKVNIKFWEDIAGYDVKILDLTADYGVSAAPSVRTTSGDDVSYSQGQYFSKSGYDVDFTDIAAPVVSGKTGTFTSAALNFKSPEAAQIGTSRNAASASVTSYYAIPKNNTTGFTFHVSYLLTSTTGETIKVQDATVFVPAENANWTANTHYTYIFKITKGSSGTTGDPGTIDPDDPKADTENALYPIVFDNCTVEEWVPSEYEYEIN